MASLPARTTASFDAIKPVSSLVLLDNELNQYVGAAGIFNGGTTGIKLLIKSSDASDPPVEIDQIGAGPLAEWKQNGTLKASIANSGQIVSAVTTGTAPLSIASTTAVTNLNADMLDGSHLADIQALINAKTVSFSIGWSIVDPATANLNSREFGSWIVPAGGTYTITRAVVMFRTGSHTSGGSLVFRIDRFGQANVSDLGLNDTNNTAATNYYDNFADLELTEGDIISCFLTTRSGTITETNVMVQLEGFRTVF